MQTTKVKIRDSWERKGNKNYAPLGGGSCISFLSPVLCTLAQSGHSDVRTRK